jgi:hypothetical protein
MLDLRSGRGHLDVHEDSHDPLEGPRYVDLLSAQERHVCESDQASSSGRERRGEVWGRGENDAHDIIRDDSIAFKHRDKQFADRLSHFSRVIGSKADRSTDGTHAQSLQTGFGVERT